MIVLQRKFPSLIFVIGFLILRGGLHAEKMDLAAHDLVIEKLETSLKNIKENDENINLLNLKIQLANLYSEKARLLFIEEGHKNCQNCLNSNNFKNKAIDLYSKILPQIKNSDGGEISLQLAHLLEDSNNPKNLKIYNDLIKLKSVKPEILVKAYSKRAAHYFKEAQFDQALNDYHKVLSLSDKKSQGGTYHKIAWAQYNKGDVEAGIKTLSTLLSQPALLTLPGSAGSDYHEGFHSEVAHDLALFMAKTEVTQASLAKLTELTPTEDIINNLLFLGEESERIGQTSNAALTWEIVLKSQNLKDERRSTILLSLSRYHLGHNRFEKASQSFTESLHLAKKTNSSNFNNHKQFLVQWEKQAQKISQIDEKNKAQIYLIKSYERYLQYNEKDYEALLWLGQLSHKRGQMNIALQSYSKAADLIKDRLDSYSRNSDAYKKESQVLNGVLLTEVSLTDSVSNPKLKLVAYDHYLSLNPNGPEYSSVRYNKAKLIYDQNQYENAYELFNDIVKDKKFTSTELKLKAAHLALDSLVLLKRVEDLETVSLKYSEIFPTQQKVFLKISYNAGMKLVETMAQEKPKKALSKMSELPNKGLSEKEKIQHLKLKIDLSLKAQEWELSLNSIKEFLSLRGLSKENYHWALTKKLSLSELLLDFKTAYETVLQLGYPQSKKSAELLKGALLAELTNEAVAPWLEKVIASSNSSKEQKKMARAQLVRLSSTPWKTLRQQIKGLQSDVQLLSQLALECYSAEPLRSEAQWILTFSKVKTTWEGQTIQRNLEISELKQKIKSISQLKMNSRSAALLAKSIQSRINALNEIKFRFNRAQKKQDWTLQIMAAHSLMNENGRLASELETLPVPKELKKNEKALFQKELKKEAKPFQMAAQDLQRFLETSWKNTEYINFLIKKIETQIKVRTVLMTELRSLASLAPKSLVNQMQNNLDKLKDKPTLNEIASTQGEIRQDPFDLDLINKLLKLELKRGNQSMVVFLEARSESIKGGRL